MVLMKQELECYLVEFPYRLTIRHFGIYQRNNSGVNSLHLTRGLNDKA